MSAIQIKANLLILNKLNEFIYETDRAWAPMGWFKTKDLSEAFDMVADDVVRVTFTTFGDYGEDDKKKFSRRLDKLSPIYVRSPWKNVEIRGHVLDNTYECTVTRSKP